jgi:hypothetical protein
MTDYAASLRVRRCRVLRDFGGVAGAFSGSGWRAARAACDCGWTSGLRFSGPWSTSRQRAAGHIGSAGDAAVMRRAAPPPAFPEIH